MSSIKSFAISVVFFLFSFIFYISPSYATAPPYPPSQTIESITWDKSTHQIAAPGSDLFPTTWAGDSDIYTAWGDGGGFGGTNNDGRVSLGVARLEGSGDNWRGFNVWGGKNPESTQTAISGKSNGGIIAINGTLYIYVAQQGSWVRSKIYSSTDYGQTWIDHGPDHEAYDPSNNGWLFDEANANAAFSAPGIIQFGKDYQNNTDGYVYGYDHKKISGSLTLFRVPKTSLLNRLAYEFFAGLDGNNNPIWSSDILQAQAAFTNPNGVNWGVNAMYHPLFKKYWLLVRHGGSNGNWGIFDAPNPWGPWTTVAYDTDFPTWTYAPPLGTAQGDPGDTTRPAWVHSIPAKWISGDGKTMWVVFDRGDQFNIAKATVALKSPTPITTLSRVMINPASINTTAYSVPRTIGISALAYDGSNNPIWNGVAYEWGISSDNSIGTLTKIYSDITDFVPQNPGTGDIFVTARLESQSVTSSIPVIVNPPPPTPTPKKQADINGDGHVNISDLGLLLSNFGRTGTGITGDVNGDGRVNITDLGILLSNFGRQT